MRASATISLLVLALFGVAFAQQTVFVSDTDVRATLSASGNTQSRTWVGTAALNSATYIGWEGQYNSQTQSASGSIALVNSFSPNTGLGVAPYSVNWAYISAQGNQNGGSATFSASAVASSFRIYGYIVYTDGNNNGVYDQGEETSLHTFDTGLGLGSASATVQAAANGKPANILVTHTTSDSKLRYIIANGDVTSQGVFNKAENAKIDFWFQPAYSANDASNARVALVTAYAGLQASVQGGGSVSTGTSGNSGQGSLSWSANGFKTQLSWTPTAAALVGGAKTSVTLKSQVLSLDQDTGFSIKAGTYVNGNQVDTQFTLGKDSGSGRYAKSNLLLFSFDAQKPTELYWDPSVGQSNNAFAKTASVLVVLASIAVALF